MNTPSRPSFAKRIALAALLLLGRVAAHDEPTSFIDLKLSATGIEASVTASNTDLAHYLPSVEPGMLLQPKTIEEQRKALSDLVTSRIELAADGLILAGTLTDISPVPEKRDLRLTFHYPWATSPAGVHVQCQLFPYDTRHKTFLNIYLGDTLLRQEIFEGERTSFDFDASSHQSIGSVVKQFVYEGVHHIFIGPDHILFVVGLLLLGGSLGHLMKIVTCFTVAHSITLGLATFHILSPPASVIEPVIALSIVFVGIHALLGKNKKHDPRMIFAFCFGLIHGFGFANALQEMMLPREALGWSLFAFNSGVEIGQACIVLTVAPLLAYVRVRRPVVSQHLIATASVCVTAAGAFWFFQRVMEG
ncbi:HupE/UreJ family protein [Luteolibacter sp. LG18]|uniref:HupE/UreJ family protein n=1 Tax=Luteolibacter sp. LG18 TaxID=2819286 RepID=UPI002B29EEEB|nr:membrane protein [Luteolibacter sp. LG18]